MNFFKTVLANLMKFAEEATTSFSVVDPTAAGKDAQTIRTITLATTPIDEQESILSLSWDGSSEKVFEKKLSNEEVKHIFDLMASDLSEAHKLVEQGNNEGAKTLLENLLKKYTVESGDIVETNLPKLVTTQAELDIDEGLWKIAGEVKMQNVFPSGTIQTLTFSSTEDLNAYNEKQKGAGKEVPLWEQEGKGKSPEAKDSLVPSSLSYADVEKQKEEEYESLKDHMDSTIKQELESALQEKAASIFSPADEELVKAMRAPGVGRNWDEIKKYFIKSLNRDEDATVIFIDEQRKKMGDDGVEIKKEEPEDVLRPPKSLVTDETHEKLLKDLQDKKEPVEEVKEKEIEKVDEAPIIEESAKKSICPECNGEGDVPAVRGGHVVAISCPSCSGDKHIQHAPKELESSQEEIARADNSDIRKVADKKYICDKCGDSDTVPDANPHTVIDKGEYLCDKCSPPFLKSSDIKSKCPHCEFGTIHEDPAGEYCDTCKYINKNASTEQETEKCSECGSVIPKGSWKCNDCGEWLGGRGLSSSVKAKVAYDENWLSKIPCADCRAVSSGHDRRHYCEKHQDPRYTGVPKGYYPEDKESSVKTKVASYMRIPETDSIVKVALELWKYPSNYMGDDLSDYYKGPAKGYDADALDKSNFKVALEMLGGEGNGVLVGSFGGFGGEHEQIFVHKDAADKVAILQDIENKMSDYPVLDDSDYSEAQMEEERESYDSWAKQEALKIIDQELHRQNPDLQESVSELELSPELEHKLAMVVYEDLSYGDGTALHADHLIQEADREGLLNDFRNALSGKEVVPENPAQMKLFESSLRKKLVKNALQKRAVDNPLTAPIEEQPTMQTPEQDVVPMGKPMDHNAPVRGDRVYVASEMSGDEKAGFSGNFVSEYSSKGEKFYIVETDQGDLLDVAAVRVSKVNEGNSSGAQVTDPISTPKVETNIEQPINTIPSTEKLTSLTSAKKCSVCHTELAPSEVDENKNICNQCKRDKDASQDDLLIIKAEAEQLLKDVEGMSKTSYMFIKKGLEKHADDSAFEGNGWCRVWVQEDEIATDVAYPEALKLPDENARIAALKEIGLKLAHEALRLADSAGAKVGVQSWFESLKPSDHDRIDWVALASPQVEAESSLKQASYKDMLSDSCTCGHTRKQHTKQVGVHEDSCKDCSCDYFNEKVEKKADNVMDTKCEECGEPLGPEVFLSKWPVCGKCTRKRHKKVTGSIGKEAIRVEFVEEEGTQGSLESLTKFLNSKFRNQEQMEIQLESLATEWAMANGYTMSWAESESSDGGALRFTKNSTHISPDWKPKQASLNLKASDFEKGISQNKTSFLCGHCGLNKSEDGKKPYLNKDVCKDCAAKIWPKDDLPVEKTADEPAVEPSKTQFKDYKITPKYTPKEEAVPVGVELDQVLSKMDALEQNLGALDRAKKEIQAKLQEEMKKIDQAGERAQMEEELQASIEKASVLIQATASKVVQWRDKLLTVKNEEIQYVPKLTQKELLEKIYAKFEKAEAFVTSVLNGMLSQAKTVTEKTLIRWPNKKSSLNKEASVIDQWNDELLAALKELSSPL